MPNNNLIIKLRKLTGAGIMDVKSAVDDAQGDEQKAIDILRKKGEKIALKKQMEREAKEGAIGVYLHTNGKVLAAIEIFCETDFVGRSEEFKKLAHELAMHIAASAPLYLNESAVPSEIVEKEKAIYSEEVKSSAMGKPAEIVGKIIQGKLSKFFEEVCLVKQKFFKDDSRTIEQLINEYTAKVGEKIVLGNFIRWQI